MSHCRSTISYWNHARAQDVIQGNPKLKKDLKTKEFDSFLMHEARLWYELAADWLSLSPSRVFVLHYEDLKSPEKRLELLGKVLDFFAIPFARSRLECLKLESGFSSLKRPKSKFEISRGKIAKGRTRFLLGKILILSYFFLDWIFYVDLPPVAVKGFPNFLKASYFRGERREKDAANNDQFKVGEKRMRRRRVCVCTRKAL